MFPDALAEGQDYLRGTARDSTISMKQRRHQQVSTSRAYSSNSQKVWKLSWSTSFPPFPSSSLELPTFGMTHVMEMRGEEEESVCVCVPQSTHTHTHAHCLHSGFRGRPVVVESTPYKNPSSSFFPCIGNHPWTWDEAPLSSRRRGLSPTHTSPPPPPLWISSFPPPPSHTACSA